MSQKDNSNEVLIIIAAMVFVIFAFFLGGKLGHEDGEIYQQKLAVKAGVGHYVADEQGNSKFEYIKK